MWRLHTHGVAHETFRVTFHLSQTHVLGLTTHSSIVRHTRRRTTVPVLSFWPDLSLSLFLFPSLSPNRSITKLRFAVRLPSTYTTISDPFHPSSHVSLLSVACTIEVRPARRSSLSHALSAWPTHRNKFHPPTLPLTHFLPTDHPLHPIGKQATRLSRRPIFRRPTDRPADRPTEKGRQRAFFPEP